MTRHRMTRHRMIMFATGALAVLAVAHPGAADSAGVGGGGSGLRFTQATTLNDYRVTLVTDSKTTKLRQIIWSCPSRTAQNTYEYSSAGLKLHHLRFSGRITFYRQESSPPAPERGYLSARWSTKSGPVKGTISVKGCRNGKTQRLNAAAGG